MHRSLLLVLLATLCGCTGPQVKDTAASVSGVLIGSALASREIDRRVEVCTVEQAGNPGGRCDSLQVGVDYHNDRLEARKQLAREARRASSEQQEHFEKTFDPDDAHDNSEMSTMDAHRSENELIESLSQELSETLSN